MAPLGAGHPGAGYTHFLLGRWHAYQRTGFD
jgi:hypothetical protein